MAYAYSYSQGPGQKAKEAGGASQEPVRQRGNCCSGLTLEEQMTKYTLVIGVMFASFLGPFSGMLAAAAADGHDSNLYTNAGATTVFFLFSLGLVLRPNLRAITRLWLLAGLAWVLGGWITYFRKDFTEMPEQWLVVTVVQSVVYGLFAFLPLFTTDPCSVAIFT